MNEHNRDVKNFVNTSALAMHVSETGHNIDFDKAKILNKESNFFKCSFSEMLNIYYHSNTLNRIEDTQFLKKSDKDTVKLIRPHCNS